MERLNLNHEAEAAYEIFNLSLHEGVRVKNLIIFEAIKGQLLLDELYPDDDDAPRALSTKSGCIERCLKTLDSEAEKQLLLFIFVEVHSNSLKAFKLFTEVPNMINRAMRDNNADGDEGLQGQLKKMLLKVTAEKLSEQSKDILEIVSMIKRSKYDFNNFMQMNGDDIDIEQTMRKVIKNVKSGFGQKVEDDDDDDF